MPKALAKNNKSKKDALDHVKWCRANLGERGVDWDFVGGIKVEVIIYSKKALVTYVLWNPETTVFTQT